MKILSASQIRDWDSFTIKHEPVKSIDLMERAAGACAEWVLKNSSKKQRLIVFCGTGNNGGDGLATAGILSSSGRPVSVYVVRSSGKPSPDFELNRKKLLRSKKVKIIEIADKFSFPEKSSSSDAIIIDAVFGTGLNKAVSGIHALVIDSINKSGLPVISIDVPSGLFCDRSTVVIHDHIVKATHTLTFELPKLAFMFHENASRTAEWHLLPIGLHSEFLNEVLTKNHFVDLDLVRSIYRKRKKFSHKGTFGHALLIAGSKGKMGAAVLSAVACLRSGVGLLTVHLPFSGTEVLNISVPEAMTEGDQDEFMFTGIKDVSKFNAIGIGPGIGTETKTANALKLLIQNSNQPMILDADALNILSDNKTWLAFLPEGSILTPHVREFERLAGKSSNDFERHQMQIDFAVKYGVFVVLKGAHTCIASPDGKSYFNSTGNPGMATAGSGDVLTGILTSLLAQGCNSLETCVLGVFLHGLAGDIAAQNLSEEALIAGDISHFLGEAFKTIMA